MLGIGAPGGGGIGGGKSAWGGDRVGVRACCGRATGAVIVGDKGGGRCFWKEDG